MLLNRLAEKIRLNADFNQSRRDAWVIARAGSLEQGSRVLDVGAGTGRYRRHFAHCYYHAQDLAAYTGTPAGIQADRWSYTPLGFISGAESLPLRDSTFDAVLCTEVLEHVPRPTAVLREIGRVLRPSGRLFLTAPLGSGLHQEPFHYYGGYTPYFYQKFLPEAGLEVVSIEPNAGFFRHLGQEIGRAGHILSHRRRWPWWHPARVIITVAASLIVPSILARVDDAIVVAEYTVGYHVEAVRSERHIPESEL
jgi:ubiquinone/menaquinone biosynthesis C-methylase UbiE